METSITLNQNSSIILAEGRRQGPGLGLLIGLAIVSGLAILLLALWLSLNQSLPVARAAGLSVTVTPTVLSDLPADIRSSLPEPIKKISERHSQWPILITLYQEENVWHWYVIMPRWLVPPSYSGARVDKGLATVLYPEKTPRETRGRAYTETLGHRIGRGPVSFQLDTGMLYSAAGFTAPTSTSIISGRLSAGRLTTDLAFQADQEPLGPLKEADIALNVPRDGVEGDLLNELIRRLDGGRQTLTQAPEVGQFHVWLSEDGTPTAIEFGYRTRLSMSQAGSLLGAYGFSSRRAFVLPDGTLSVERVAPIFSSTSTPFGERVNEDGERVQLEPTGLRILASSTTSPGALPAKNACDDDPSWLRLSGQLLGRAGKAIGWEGLPTNLPAIQFSQEQGNLIICME